MGHFFTESGFALLTAAFFTDVTGMVTRELSRFDTTGCGRTKGCFRQPPRCDADTCSHLVTWRQQGGDVTWQLFWRVGDADSRRPWTAVGISNNRAMSSTPVVDCIFNASSSRVVVQLSYNDGYDNEPLDNRTSSLVDGSYSGSYADGVLSCRFTLYKSIPGEWTRRGSAPDLRQPAYVMLGSGPATDTGVKLRHSRTPVVSQTKVDFSRHNDILGRPITSWLIKAHACVMLVTWMLIASVGILTSRHFKDFGPTLEGLAIWFRIHRASMTCCVLFTAAGIALLLIHYKGRIPVDYVHTKLGITVACLVALNTMLAVVRPSVDSPHRATFTWAHRIAGTSAQIIALVALHVAVSGDRYPSWAAWLVVGFAVCRLAVDVLLSLLSIETDSTSEKFHLLLRNTPDERSKGKNMVWRQDILSLFLIGTGVVIGLLIYGVLTS